MARTSTNRLTVYQIKSKFRSLSEIVERKTVTIEVGSLGTFVYERSQPAPPTWLTKFFGNRLDEQINILTSSAKALFLVPLTENDRKTYFAISFGQGRHLLKEGVVEERFGLRVVLNSVGAESFRSIDKTALGAIPKHSREQMSRDVAPGEFGIDVEQDLVSSVTGRSQDPTLGSILTGKDALHISAPVDVTNIATFLCYARARSRSKAYRTNFDWIDQIREVRDTLIEDKLNAELIDRLGQGNLEKTWMAVPEVIDWASVAGFRSVRPKRAKLRADLILQEFLDELEGDTLSIDALKNAHVYAIEAQNEDPLQRWSAFRCLYAEVELGRKRYILNNGKWYQIAPACGEQVQADFQGIPDARLALPEYTGGSELAYNQSAAQILGNACCMDQRMISHGGGHNKIEFCDILTRDKKLVHVKKYGGSSVLSHLFMQGAVSGELLVSDGEFRARLNQLLPRGYKLSDPKRTKPRAADYDVVFAIISGSVQPLDIPFFSKVSLRSARRRLEGYGYSVKKQKIQRV